MSSSKLINMSLDNNFFGNYACKLYNKEFWQRAKLRPMIKSKPLGSMYAELLRLEKFQNI